MVVSSGWKEWEVTMNLRHNSFGHNRNRDLRLGGHVSRSYLRSSLGALPKLL